MKKFLIVSLMLSIPAFLSASEEAKKLDASPKKVNILRISNKTNKLHESPNKALERKANSPRDSSEITTDNWGHKYPFCGPVRRVNGGFFLGSLDPER